MDKNLQMQFEFIRQSGETNMMDHKAVQRLAHAAGLYILAEVCQDRSRYAQLLGEFEQPDEKEYQEWKSDRTESDDDWDNCPDGDEAVAWDDLTSEDDLAEQL